MIEVWLQTLLTSDGNFAAKFDDRAYPVQAPDAPTYPYCVIHRVGGAPQYDMQGPINLGNPRIQIDVFDLTMEKLLLAKEVVKGILSGFHGAVDSSGECVIDSCFNIADFDLNETSTERAGPRVKRRILEFSIWAKEA